jgi:hypothetical protein
VASICCVPACAPPTSTPRPAASRSLPASSGRSAPSGRTLKSSSVAIRASAVTS